jgi:CubicO group peptidase (beta-lactamase class C family)
VNQEQLQALICGVRQKTEIPGIVATVASATTALTALEGVASLDSGAALTTECRFQLGCITKLLTTLVVSELARTKTLDLQAPVAEYISEFHSVPKAKEILIGHLASHTSGYQGPNIARPEVGYFYSWKKFADQFAAAPQLFQPGTVFNYEHTEAVILGEIVRRAIKVSPHELIRQLVFEPLRLIPGRIKSDSSQTQFHVCDHGAGPANAGYKTLRTVPYSPFWLSSLSDITLSAADLLTLGWEMINANRSKLGRETIVGSRRQMVRVTPTIGGAQREQTPLSFGLGCAQYPGGLFGHNGSARGQTCAFRFSPERGMVIVIALNTWNPWVRDWIVNRVAASVEPGEPASCAVATPDLDRLEDWEGCYASCVQGVTLTARRQREELVCNVINEPTGTAVNLEVVRDSEGNVIVKSDMPYVSLGLFRDHGSGVPCLMLGMNAFRRVS